MRINIKIDSRSIKPGDTFLALRGTHDGHQYIEDAIKAGATRIVCEEGNYEVETYIVHDTKVYLEAYLKKNYGKYINQMKVIGITGTNGKTTSSFLLYTALSQLGKKAAYIGTVGFYKMGKKERPLLNTTPDLVTLYEIFLECYESGVEYVAMEISSHGLMLDRVAGLEFDYAVFTNLTQDHLDFHKTMANYALAKQKLFYMLKKDGKAIVNYDDAHKDTYLLDENDNITFGFTGGDYHMMDVDMNHIETKFTYSYHDTMYQVHSPLLGKYNIENLMISIIILRDLGLNNDELDALISKLTAPAGRMDTVRYGTNSIIIDYAHTPDAIEKIMETMIPLTSGNIYVVFGCTGNRDRTKRPIMTEYVTKHSLHAIITIDDPHDEDVNQIVEDMLDGVENRNYEVVLDRGKAIHKGIDYLKENDVLLILGKGHEDVIIMGDKRIPFNDKEVAQQYISRVKVEE